MIRKTVVDAYNSYSNPSTRQAERHTRRLLIMAMVSLFLAVLGRADVVPSFSLMATAVSVIAGFTFSALFSTHAIAIADLRFPKSPEDKDDWSRLNRLDVNHKARTKYFFMLCVAELALLAALVVDYKLPGMLRRILHDLIIIIAAFFDASDDALVGEVSIIYRTTLKFLISILNAFVVFIFAECLYTFYRLSESILKVIEIRKSYIERSLKSKADMGGGL